MAFAYAVHDEFVKDQERNRAIISRTNSYRIHYQTFHDEFTIQLGCDPLIRPDKEDRVIYLEVVAQRPTIHWIYPIQIHPPSSVQSSVDAPDGQLDGLDWNVGRRFQRRPIALHGILMRFIALEEGKIGLL